MNKHERILFGNFQSLVKEQQAAKKKIQASKHLKLNLSRINEMKTDASRESKEDHDRSPNTDPYRITS